MKPTALLVVLLLFAGILWFITEFLSRQFGLSPGARASVKESTFHIPPGFFACPQCAGSGKGEWRMPTRAGGSFSETRPMCITCDGKGYVGRLAKEHIERVDDMKSPFGRTSIDEDADTEGKKGSLSDMLRQPLGI